MKMIVCRNSDMLESRDFLFYASPYAIARNQAVEKHAHEFVELAYVAEGEGEHEYRGRKHLLKEGDCFLIEPNEAHSYRVGPHAGLVMYNVLFQPSVLNVELEALRDEGPFDTPMLLDPPGGFDFFVALEPAERLEMMYLLDRIVAEFNVKKLGYRILIKTHLIDLFVFLGRCSDRRRQRLQPFEDAQAGEEKMIRQVCAWIETNYDKPMTLERISRRCGMRKSAFSALFKRHTGKAFADYCNGVRIQVAKQLLENGDDKLIQIASQAGFDNCGFFNKYFARTVGMAPGQYRRERRAGSLRSDK
ncbi:AraC family transcriptional regulator [Cohnella soli]|uniref:Helix-turn-helix domain-containing protein n=1 Tax=Cohnella soli TaxID=425005 RepID=A0ABW0HYC7_9BACL